MNLKEDLLSAVHAAGERLGLFQVESLQTNRAGGPTHRGLDTLLEDHSLARHLVVALRIHSVTSASFGSSTAHEAQYIAGEPSGKSPGTSFLHLRQVTTDGPASASCNHSAETTSTKVARVICSTTGGAPETRENVKQINSWSVSFTAALGKA